MSKRARAIADEILHQEVMHKTLERQIAHERKRLISDLSALTIRLEVIGEDRMGLVTRRMAQRYHTTVARLRAIVTDLGKGEGLS